MTPADVYADVAVMRMRKRIEEIYSEAAKDIDRKIKDFNQRYKVKESKHLQELADGKITQKQFDSWKRGQVFQGERWKAKKEEVAGVINDANNRAIKMVNDERTKVFAYNANYMAYTLEHKAGLNFGFDLYDSATVVNLIKDQPQLLPEWKIHKRKDYVWNYKKVNSAITQGIVQGEKLDDIATRLAIGLQTANKNKMLTFARTGMTEAQNSGRQTRLGEAKGMGIKVHKEWMATLDEHTRWQHADLDGQKQPIDKPFEIGGYKIRYPGDPQAHPSMVYNCRCTMVGDLDDYPSEYERYDNIDGKPIKGMTYREWEAAKGKTYSKSRAPIVPSKPKFNQVGIGQCKTVQEVNDLLNSNDLWATREMGGELYWDDKDMKYKRRNPNIIVTKVDLTGCDLDSAKSIASSYEQIFLKFPQLKGKLDAPNAQPVGMKDSTYAWCYIKRGGQVQVNPDIYKNWQSVVRRYESDVLSGWHPKGTTAESIVTHEIGHAIDGLLAREGVLGGVTASGEYRYASSSLKATIMKRAAKLDPDLDSWLSGDKWQKSYAVEKYVSRYASKNPQEWFAECFAEYITSANPRVVSSEFGKELEKLMRKLK